MMQPYLEEIFISGWPFRPIGLRIMITGLMACIPVLFLAALGIHASGSKYTIVELLRGEAPAGREAFSVFGMLTIIQFGIVTVLMGFSIVIGRQINYMDNKDLGYNEDNIYIIRIPAQQPRGSILVEEVKKHAGVISASTVHHHPGDIYQQMEFAARGKSYPFGFRMADPGIFEVLDIRLTKQFGDPTGRMDGWIINETFYNQLLQDFTADDIASSNFSIENDDPDDSKTGFLIAGVMEDFHYSSLYNNIGNFAFVMRHPETEYNRWLMVRYQEDQSEAVLAAINTMMGTFFPGRFYDSFLLKDSLNAKYQADQNLSKIIVAFTVLSVLIACFGLYGLSLFMTQRRTREIGIRKVHGADSWQIITMLNLGFLRWVGIAIIFAIPVTFWSTMRWLEHFAYRTTPAWWIFVLTGIIITGIAMTVVTWQTAVSAQRNPVHTIRYE
jgi:putative ABC transport system permease protein